MKIDYTLYLVTDSQFLKGRSLVDEVVRAVEGGVSIVQLREKNLSSRAFYELALALKTKLSLLNTPLIINDRLDIALAVDADGLHLGQEDLPISAARSLLGSGKIIGISASTLAEAIQGKNEGADYLGLGPIFATTTKNDAAIPTGTGLIRHVKRILDLPVVAIGGINTGNIALVKAAGACGAAVISALMGSNDVEKAARKMVQIWQNA